MLSVAICIATVVLAVVYMVLSITIVPAGTVGVVDVFGQVRDDPLPAGMNFVFPLASVVKMSIKTQIIELAENVPTKEGLTVHLEAAALIRLEPQEAVKMYRQVGCTDTHAASTRIPRRLTAPGGHAGTRCARHSTGRAPTGLSPICAHLTPTPPLTPFSPFDAPFAPDAHPMHTHCAPIMHSFLPPAGGLQLHAEGGDPPVSQHRPRGDQWPRGEGLVHERCAHCHDGGP